MAWEVPDLIIIASGAVAVIPGLVLGRAWWLTRERRLLWIAVAFWLFALRGLVELVDSALLSDGPDIWTDVISALADLALVVLFIVAFWDRGGGHGDADGLDTEPMLSASVEDGGPDA